MASRDIVLSRTGVAVDAITKRLGLEVVSDPNLRILNALEASVAALNDQEVAISARLSQAGAEQYALRSLASSDPEELAKALGMKKDSAERLITKATESLKASAEEAAKASEEAGSSSEPTEGEVVGTGAPAAGTENNAEQEGVQDAATETAKAPSKAK